MKLRHITFSDLLLSALFIGCGQLAVVQPVHQVRPLKAEATPNHWTEKTTLRVLSKAIGTLALGVATWEVAKPVLPAIGELKIATIEGWENAVASWSLDNEWLMERGPSEVDWWEEVDVPALGLLSDTTQQVQNEIISYFTGQSVPRSLRQGSRRVLLASTSSTIGLILLISVGGYCLCSCSNFSNYVRGRCYFGGTLSCSEGCTYSFCPLCYLCSHSSEVTTCGWLCSPCCCWLMAAAVALRKDQGLCCHQYADCCCCLFLDDENRVKKAVRSVVLATNFTEEPTAGGAELQVGAAPPDGAAEAV